MLNSYKEQMTEMSMEGFLIDFNHSIFYFGGPHISNALAQTPKKYKPIAGGAALSVAVLNQQ
jgi:hypothetical protein